MSIEIGDKSYELVYNLKRLEMAEASAKASTIALFQTQPMMQQLIVYAACGLRLEGSPAYVNPKQGASLIEEWLETGENGYLSLYQLVTDALNRDCGFLFR